MGMTLPSLLLLSLLLGCAGLLEVAAQNGCPSRCHCQLEEFPTFVNCSGRELFGFPADIHPLIQIVDLSHNKIRNVPSTLADLQELQHLTLASNLITSLEPWTFYNLKELQTLDLSSNVIHNLTAIHANTIVAGTSKLQTLSLSGNPITELDTKDRNGLLKSLTIEVLDLSACNISYIQTGSFLVELENLRILNLSRNPLKFVSALTSKTLQHLDLSRCQLDSIHPSALVNLPLLEGLSVSHNQRFRFSSSKGVFSHSLQILEARSCDVALTNLKAFPNLTHVNLRGNAIEEILPGTLINERLVELDLSRNNIKRISPVALINLYNLETLNLERNSFSRLNWNIFSNNVKLTTVTLSKNLLTRFNFSSISITTLDVSHCSIQELSLSSMPSLLKLNLSDNKLEYIPGNFKSLTLADLDLSSCRLSTIGNDTFRDLPNLRFLNLAGNRLTTTLKDYHFYYNENLDGILLSNNPWICDCEADDFQVFVYYLMKLRVKDIQEVRCSSPENMGGLGWDEACYDVWYQPPQTEEGMLQRYGVVVLTAVLAVFALCLIVRIVRRTLKTRRKKRSERRRQVEEERDHALEIHAQMLRRNLQEEDEDESRTPTPRFRPRVVSEPPTYEEAVLMSRSQEDLLHSRETRVKVVAPSILDQPGGSAEEQEPQQSESRQWESDADYSEVDIGTRSENSYELSSIHRYSSSDIDTESEPQSIRHKEANNQSSL